MSRKKKIDRAVDDVECPVQCGCNAHVASDFFEMIFNNVDFQLLLTQILHLNLKRVKIASNDMEYLDKVPGVKNQSVFKEAYVMGYFIY